LGWINDYPNASCWNDFPWLRGYLNGARERCEAMGYRLQQIDLGEGANNPEDEVKAASRILLQQSIYGVVLPLVLNTAYLETRWENCVISVIGGGHREESGNHTEFPSLIYPQGFPSADRDLYYNSRLAFRNLRKLDYSRIGLVYSKYLDNEAHGRTRAGFLIEQNTQSPESHVPVLMLERFKEGRPLEFDEWFEKHKPDAIMCVNPVIRTWVESMGLSVPKDVGLVNLNIVDDVSEWSGVNENHDAIGAAAVDLILSALSRNELGMNPQPRKILVPGTWLEGTTLRAPANL
jgi:LacI family transcriptional regulator